LGRIANIERRHANKREGERERMLQDASVHERQILKKERNCENSWSSKKVSMCVYERERVRERELSLTQKPDSYEEIRE
jgi:hypothetical protein